MKILMTTDTVGGVWTYAVELARALQADHVAVQLATMGAPLSEAQHEQVEAFGLEVHPSDYRLEWMQDPWLDVEAAGRWLLELADDFQPDVVHLNNYAHAALPFEAPTVVVAHSCVVSWWRAVHGQDPPAEWNQYRDTVRQSLDHADLVLAPTWAMLHALEQCYGPLRRVGVIANGRDSLALAPGRKEPFILAAGRLWDEAKNIGALKTIGDRVDWPIHIAGETRHPVTRRCAASNLHSLGALRPAEMADWLARASIFVHPARYEPFGLSVLEAALAGCALVLGDIASLRELWHDAAVFVHPEDHEALGRALNDLAADPTRRRALARHACQRALAFTPQRMAEAYQRTYRHLLTPSRPLPAEPPTVRPAPSTP